jgi:hypothetical protein
LRFLIFITILVIASIACSSPKAHPADVNDIVIAEVGNRILYKSKINDLFNAEIDSLERDILIKGFVSNWIREQLMIKEAESNLSRDIDIDDLVETYRSSLILNYYENKLVNDLLDTVITQQQLKDYYEESKNEFILIEPIVKAFVFGLRKTNVKQKVRKAFNNNDVAELFELVGNQLTTQVVEPSKWQPMSNVLALLPEKKYNNKILLKKGTHSKRDGKIQYFVKIVDVVDKDSVPPLGYIESKIKRIILNNRKKALIKRKKQQLYDQNYNNNNIKIHLN